MSAMGIGLIIFIILFFVLGVAMYYMVQGSGKRYIIAGKSLPFFLIGSMLLAQSLDANATMGNAAGVYSLAVGGPDFNSPSAWRYAFLFVAYGYAKPLNRMNLLTLPDFYFRRFNWFTEIIVSLLMCI